MRPGQQFSFKKSYFSHSFGQQGQLVVEYVILLVIVVALALLITNTVVSRSDESPGFLVSKWRQIIQLISNDQPESPSSQ